jgi:hypothetical protein
VSRPVGPYSPSISAGGWVVTSGQVGVVTGERGPQVPGRSGSRPNGHGLDQVGVLLAQLGPQAPDVDVDGAGAAVVLVAPDPAEQGLAGEDLARVGGQEAQQLVLHVGEVEGPAGHRGLVGLEVEHEGAVLDELGSRPRPVRQKRWARRAASSRGGGQDAEVVEVVLAQLQVGDLVGRDDEQQRASGTSRRRRCRHRAKAPGRRSRRPPPRPSRPRARRPGVLGRATPSRGSRRLEGEADLGGRGRGSTAAGVPSGGGSCRVASEGQVAVELELADVGLVGAHSARLLRMNHSKTCSPRVSATSSERSISTTASLRLPGSERMPFGGQLLGGHGEEVGAASRGSS